jgi:hypothetical protein
MARMVFITIAISLLLNSCNGQTLKNEKTTKDSINAPKTAIKVNKEYDKNGNLIKYDSTYSYYYSNIQNNPVLADSILNIFKNNFNEKYFFSNAPYFNDMFFQDSLMFYDFYKKDFFQNRFKNNMSSAERMFWEMDSIKNMFFDQQFRNKK